MDVCDVKWVLVANRRLLWKRRSVATAIPATKGYPCNRKAPPRRQCSLAVARGGLRRKEAVQVHFLQTTFRLRLSNILQTYFNCRFNNAEFGQGEGDSVRRGPEIVLEEERSTIPGVEQSNEEEQIAGGKKQSRYIFLQTTIHLRLFIF